MRRVGGPRTDQEATLEEVLSSEPDERQLLWIDLGGTIDDDDLAALAARFALEGQARDALAEPRRHPQLAVHGSSVDLCVAAKPGHAPARAPTWLDIVAGRHFVITRHDGDLVALDELDERISQETTLGAIGGVELVGLLLDHVVTGYLAAVDEIENAIDALDAGLLRREGQSDLLDRLVRLRHRIGGLRRLLAAHRETFAALAGPDVRQLATQPDTTEDLKVVTKRFETAVGAVEASREALLGSFNVYMTRTAQKTNDVMKVLTIATVVLLPGSLIAGLLGMNVAIPFAQDDPLTFWIVVVGMAALAIVILGWLRFRRWI